MERLRSHLGIDRWAVAGARGGVTLALVYAPRHPDRVLGMVLAAVASGRWRETQWITRDMGRVFPCQWDRVADPLPEADRGGDLAAAYARLLASPDRAVREEAARRWCQREDTHMSRAPGYEPHLSVRELSWPMVFARLVTRYRGHGCFLADNELLADMARIAHIPAVLIHGLHDVSGPLDTAWELHKAWPASRLVVIGDARSLRRKHGRAVHRRHRRHGRPAPPRIEPPKGALPNICLRWPWSSSGCQRAD
jgi:proline iminopeptidase